MEYDFLFDDPITSCPLCSSPPHAFQIDMNTAVILCKNVKCIYPYGHGPLIYISRDIFDSNLPKPESFNILGDKFQRLSEDADSSLCLEEDFEDIFDELLNCKENDINQDDQLINQHAAIKDELQIQSSPDILLEDNNNTVSSTGYKSSDIYSQIRNEHSYPQAFEANVSDKNVGVTKNFRNNSNNLTGMITSNSITKLRPQNKSLRGKLRGRGQEEVKRGKGLMGEGRWEVTEDGQQWRLIIENNPP